MTLCALCFDLKYLFIVPCLTFWTNSIAPMTMICTCYYWIMIGNQQSHNHWTDVFLKNRGKVASRPLVVGYIGNTGLGSKRINYIVFEDKFTIKRWFIGTERSNAEKRLFKCRPKIILKDVVNLIKYSVLLHLTFLLGK